MVIDTPVDTTGTTLSIIKEEYKAVDVIAKDKAKEDLEDVYGYATLPIGVAADVVMGDLTAGVDFQTRLVTGADASNIDKEAKIRDYEMPIYAGLDVGYALAMGDMTITPNAGFKYSSDFWKWGVNKDGDEWEYKGDVTEADYLGRPMSANVGVDVAGIAGMVDVSLSVGLGFGDGNYNHGLAAWGFPAIDKDGNFAPTLAAFIEAINEMNPDDDDENDKVLISSANATELAIGITVTPPMVAGLTITNDFAYNTGGLGFVGWDDDDEPPTLYGLFLDEITNDTMVAYDIMVGEAVGATIFGKLEYSQIVPSTEDGTIWEMDPYGKKAMEQASKSTFDYEVGVKATVSF
jgi:hypothetical protein